ncbi:hypothetical protein Ngar_c24250 [Candidatus Nitrososphaera gargensis Ga9.2]|uniref:Uncharacterized protein n=1 Tax=Nitrososphaera gargensis (strain Ga9.2) TaxID=1237085 RepID=K0ING8_NITGG|nr:hypothetical protein Ngar_c24250 [Candidatus Nitrososphaera gargensis Ga9.2]
MPEKLKWSVISLKIFLSYQLSLTQSLSPDVEMVLLTPDEINRFISTLKSRYTTGPVAKKKTARARSA